MQTSRKQNEVAAGKPVQGFTATATGTGRVVDCCWSRYDERRRAQKVFILMRICRVCSQIQPTMPRKGKTKGGAQSKKA